MKYVPDSVLNARGDSTIATVSGSPTAARGHLRSRTARPDASLGVTSGWKTDGGTEIGFLRLLHLLQYQWLKLMQCFLNTLMQF